MAARRPVNRRHVVERRRRPKSIRRHRFEAGGNEWERRIDLIRGLVESCALQPDDARRALLDLRTLRLVRLEMMRFEMAVNERVRMASAGLVRMQRRKRRTKDEERRDYEPRRHASNRTKHGTIMAVGDKPVKHAPPKDFAFRMPTRSSFGSP